MISHIEQKVKRYQLSNKFGPCLSCGCGTSIIITLVNMIESLEERHCRITGCLNIDTFEFGQIISRFYCHTLGVLSIDLHP